MRIFFQIESLPRKPCPVPPSCREPVVFDKRAAERTAKFFACGPLHCCAGYHSVLFCGQLFRMTAKLLGRAGGCIMAEHFIPDDLAQFVLEKIESVAQLEALLLLRSDPEKAWSTEALAARLYIGEEQTAELLRGLAVQGLVTAEANASVHRYQPVTAELNEMLDRLAGIYAKHLVPVTNLIHSKPKPRIQEFADAFRLRKDK